jgi:hypothetical protein
MKVLDPCCGSGIFLVVAFRRLVELEMVRRESQTLTAFELRKILVESIFGVERNRTACGITAFSLILALLSYVRPPDLQRLPTFKFPTLVGTNLYCQDFFDERGGFWSARDGSDSRSFGFDWIIGNPPWVELDAESTEAQHILRWSKARGKEVTLPRLRSGEAFAWKVLEGLKSNGVAGLILHGKCLTNDQLKPWRAHFFRTTHLRRVTNFSNLAYKLFPSAQQPAVTLVFQHAPRDVDRCDIHHFGPFVAHHPIAHRLGRGKRRAWTIGFTESEVKSISPGAPLSGDAFVWKRALWGTTCDDRCIGRLKAVFSQTLGEVALRRGWQLALGLQLREDEGTERDPNEAPFDEQGNNRLEGLRVLDHKVLVKTGGTLLIPSNLLESNDYGTFIRKRGGDVGLALINGPWLVLWNDFAAYSEEPFIVRHSKVGLAGGSAKEMKAVAAIWSSSYVGYLLFFVLSSDWGVGVSLIDKGDAERLPFPDLQPAQVEVLSAAWEKAAEMEGTGHPFREVRRFLDDEVADIFAIPPSVQVVIREFFDFRYPLNKGKCPPEISRPPEPSFLRPYALRLRDELDAFLGGTGRHRISVLSGKSGVAVSVALEAESGAVRPKVEEADSYTQTVLDGLLEAAEKSSPNGPMFGAAFGFSRVTRCISSNLPGS